MNRIAEMQQHEVLSLLASLARPLGSQLTRAQAIEFFLAFLRSSLQARRAQVLIFNEHGDPVPYPKEGESSASGCDVSIDVIEQAMSTAGLVVAGQDYVIPLRVEPKPFGVIAIEAVKQAPDLKLLEVIGAMASGLVCCGQPPKV